MKYLILFISAFVLSSCATTETKSVSVAKSSQEEIKEVVKKKCKRSKKTTGMRTSRTNCNSETSNQH